MGTLKKSSRKDLKIRDLFPEEEQPTLLTCPVCGGHGKKELKRNDGNYSIVVCNWCDGNGSVTKSIHMAFSRWLSIRAANGNCNKL